MTEGTAKFPVERPDPCCQRCWESPLDVVGDSVASCVVHGGRALSVVPVRDWLGPGMTVCCSVDDWLVVTGSVVVLVGSVCWVAGLGMV